MNISLLLDQNALLSLMWNMYCNTHVLFFFIYILTKFNPSLIHYILITKWSQLGYLYRNLILNSCQQLPTCTCKGQNEWSSGHHTYYMLWYMWKFITQVYRSTIPLDHHFITLDLVINLNPFDIQQKGHNYSPFSHCINNSLHLYGTSIKASSKMLVSLFSTLR